MKLIKHKQLRQMMRGYRNLKKDGQLHTITNIKIELTSQKLSINKKFYSQQFFGGGIESAELIVRQYLLVRIGGINLNKALLLAAGKANGCVRFSMPSEWADVIEKYGFRVDRFKSAFMWRLYLLMMLIKGVLKIISIVITDLDFIENRQIKIKPYVYFLELIDSNLPKGANWQAEHNIVSWYLQWNGRKSYIKTICHNIPNVVSKNFGDIQLITQSSPVPILTNTRELITYIRWALFSISLAFIDLIRYRWWHPLLLNQSALSAQVRVVPSEFLATEYFFHNSNWIYRPLWTYDAEQQGAMITFYFYSTNCEPFKKESGYPEIPYGWKAMSWPRYLVWDDYQANFVRRCVGKEPEINVAGPIWFNSNLVILNNIPSKTVAVFDVQPFRSSFYNLLAIDFDYYTPQVTIQFLKDIQDVLSTSPYAMALKRKRDIGAQTHPKYLSCVEALSNSKDFIEIDSGISAAKLIDKCDFVISMPFTSTALLGYHAGKPSIYYDPFIMLKCDDRAAHGIPIVQGKEKLRAWFLTAMEKNFVCH